MSFKNSLLLRRSEELSGPAANPKWEVTEGGKLGKIVVAESNPSDLDHIASVLRNLNFTVLTAQDGKTALTLTRRHLPLLVLSALDLPQIDGYKLMQKLRERRETESIPFMFVLMSGETPDRLIGHETNAHDYIQKPFLVSELESRVMALLHPVLRRRDDAVGPADEVVARETSPEKTGIPEEASARVDVALEGTLARMRRRLAELSDLLGLLEQKCRFPAAIDDPRADRERTSKRAPAGESEGGNLIRFQGVRDRSAPVRRPSPDRSVVERRGAAVSEPIESVFAEKVDVLETLRKYRAEYRELSESVEGECDGEVGTPEPEAWDFAGDREERDPGEGRAAEAPAELGRTDGSPAEEPSGEDFRERFDPDLLAKLGVGIGGPAAGDQIKEEEFTRFARQSFLSAFLDGSETAGRRDSLYEEALEYVLRSIRRAAVGESPYVARAEMLIGRLIDSLAENDELLLRATERDAVFSVSGHSVNVAVLSVKIAQVRGRSPQFQSRVGLAALFHEIGVVKLPEKLVFKEEPLPEEELNVLRRRPLFSARVLQESFRLVGDIAGQVFEREDGSGHPMGLRGGEIRDEAKIIGVADFFEACIHRRPYREPLTGYQALYELSRDGAFQREVVGALIRCVSLFPLNEILVLTTGEVGRVSSVNPANLARPRVRLLLDPDGVDYPEPREIDLMVNRGVDIAEVLTLEGLASRRAR